jgi:hypothetical protein
MSSLLRALRSQNLHSSPRNICWTSWGRCSRRNSSPMRSSTVASNNGSTKTKRPSYLKKSTRPGQWLERFDNMSKDRTHFDPSDLLVALSLRGDELEDTQLSRLKFRGAFVAFYACFESNFGSIAPLSFCNYSESTSNSDIFYDVYYQEVHFVQNYKLFESEIYGPYRRSPLL